MAISGNVRSSLLSVLLLKMAAGPSAAEEAGSFEFKTTFDNKLLSLKLDADSISTPNSVSSAASAQREKGSYAFSASVDGLGQVVKSSGGLFAAGDKFTYECVGSGINVPGWVEVEAYCVMNDVTTGDQWYRKSTRTAEDYDSGSGNMVLFGGTGRFANVRGACQYEVLHVTPSSRGSLHAKCDWRLQSDTVHGSELPDD